MQNICEAWCKRLIMTTNKETAISGVLEIYPDRFDDDRGFFSEIYNLRRLAALGINETFVQDNLSLSTYPPVLRGLHFQRRPHAQAKLIGVMTGSIFDVIVDIREGSPTYKQWFGLKISAKKGNQLFVPKGFAHGFLTLEANTSVFYKVTDYYSKEDERSIRYDDPDIGITWPATSDDPIISDKDKAAPMLVDVDNNYKYLGGT
ncbi:dTDP-4-dehydrorhamnose 3,5-epimerase (plasmid) [Hoeflea sp. IMCC20628]|uniref:dTDP-4-dehydrorhamnose 3,5-epimerase n=1 Tax=Hoeflea sp. IMCC20628 TaxID=1620421 RepID=UPI00063BE97B|nr:dTDP-4-dehydrorhamnose 3,5-epimerase [Hoeflea sp. IMCC20628]